MTITPELDAAAAVERAYVECRLCGSRLQQNLEPDLLEVGTDSVQTVARHRCVPPVEARV